MSNRRIWKIRVDTGGTFTDCFGIDPKGSIHRCKVLSSGALRGQIVHQINKNKFLIDQEWQAPDNFINGFSFRLTGDKEIYTVGSFDAENSILSLEEPLNALLQPEGLTFDVRTDEEAPVLGARLLTKTLAGEQFPPLEIRLATTKGTNALLERKGAKTFLLTTRGFGDLLKIDNQQRPDLFSLEIKKPDPLPFRVIEIPERIDSQGEIIVSPDFEALEKTLSTNSDNIESIAVCMMNSYSNPQHEKMIASLLSGLGFRYLSVSSGLNPSIKFLPRTKTTVVNAYLAPLMEKYIGNVEHQMNQPDLYIMTSTGGLNRSARYQPKDGLLSGPAAGITGAAAIGNRCGIEKLISFDMGGTSTDVSRYNHGFDYLPEHKVGDAHLLAPAISIETVAAGGGSICDFDGESLTVGPESAGADPGPACYGADGPLTITDVNLLAGRLEPENFHIPLDIEAAKEAFHNVFLRIRKQQGEEVSGPEILQGFLDIANERMAQAMAAISTAKGFNPSEYALVAFGGAGGQHATAVASRLKIHRVIVPADAGILSAYGLDRSRIEAMETRQYLELLDQIEPKLDSRFRKSRKTAIKKLKKDGVHENNMEIVEQTILARFQGQDSTIEIPWNPGVSVKKRFRNVYRDSFGYWIENREIEVVSIRVGLSEKVRPAEVSVFEKKEVPPPLKTLRNIEYRGKRLEMPVYHRDDLEPGTVLSSPALILDAYSTLFAEPGWEVRIRSDRTIDMFRQEPLTTASDVSKKRDDSTSSDTGNSSSTTSTDIKERKHQSSGRSISGSDHPGNSGKHKIERDRIINLQLYTNRFTAITEQMGEMLMRTALSINVKERLDFSCALLDQNGYLVANAHHIPVHLGAMGLCVRRLKEQVQMKEGDVLMTNHPGYGGSHLPDITVVSPVFAENRLVGYVASRAHHAEIGGKTPGSMPPDATSLAEEGVAFPPTWVIRDNRERWDKIRKQLETAPWPSRNPKENMADLQAAVAANHKGNQLLIELIKNFGIDHTTRYMAELKSYAASRMSLTLDKLKNGIYEAEEKMDDGSILKVQCKVTDSRLKVDFTGTSGVHPGNLNANPAIVNSVLIYVLRLLVNEPLPLNDGLFGPVDIILPESMLNPPYPEDPAQCPAVVGGNIETSQRLVDTLLKAFELSACSQGTMNNILFGNNRFGYYETVAGGTGAGQGFHGTDGVHQHMTNTAATDPEILEHRYPVRLDKFAIRTSSGGRGQWNGGNGLIREYTFLEPVELSVLTQHRTVKPYGLKGGKPGKTGRQTLIRKNGTEIELSWKDSIHVSPGDRFILKTPGGGGYG